MNWKDKEMTPLEICTLEIEQTEISQNTTHLDGRILLSAKLVNLQL